MSLDFLHETPQPHSGVQESLLSAGLWVCGSCFPAQWRVSLKADRLPGKKARASHGAPGEAGNFSVSLGS